MKKLSHLLLFSFLSISLSAQTVLTIDQNQLVQSGGYLVLENTKFINNGAYHAARGEVLITGDAQDRQAQIGGTANTTFYNLTIDKQVNNVALDQDISIRNALHLTSGLLDLGDYNLNIEAGASIDEYSENEYIKTSGNGTLNQIVGIEAVEFPIGVNTYKPLQLQNRGTTDQMKIRVEEAVYEEGTLGKVIHKDAVNASWYIDEAKPGGSQVDLRFQWLAADELRGFDRSKCKVNRLSPDAQASSEAMAALGTHARRLDHQGINTLGIFTINSDGLVQWSEAVKGQPKAVQTDFSVFPNPTRDYLFIENAHAG
ncbi:MAG: hypothetical protein AAF985_20960, partial [Bacteroidota bacterium]